MTSADVAAVVLAAGAGRRMGAEVNKVFLPLAGRPILARTLDVFDQDPAVGRTLLVAAQAEVAQVRELVATYGLRSVAQVVPGGATRHESERAGLEALSMDIASSAVRVVLVHDAARPLVTADEVDRVIAAARSCGAAALALRAQAEHLVALSESGRLEEAPADLWAMQTPQGFDARLILDAHRAAAANGFSGPDTASVAEHAGHQVRVVEGRWSNFKITTPEDLVLAELILQGAPDGEDLLQL